MKKVILFAVVCSLLLLTSCVGTRIKQNTLWMNNLMDRGLELVMNTFNEKELCFLSVVGTVDHQNVSERHVNNPLSPDDISTWVLLYSYGNRETEVPVVVEIDYENGTWSEPYINSSLAPTGSVLFNLPVHVSIDLDEAIERAWNSDFQNWLGDLAFIELTLPLELRETGIITEPVYRFQRIGAPEDFLLIGAFSGKEYCVTNDD